MILRLIKYSFLVFLNFVSVNYSFSEKINNINIIGNERISDEVIIMFSEISKGSDIDLDEVNLILKRIYQSNFFENVDVKFVENNLSITVEELPIIQEIKIQGIKAKKIKEAVFKDLSLKERKAFNKNILNIDVSNIKFNLQEIGYYFATVDVSLIELSDNKVDLVYKIKLGDKAKIKKIKFIGNKIFKDRKLKNIITSEESKFWKFISGKKYLNQNLINFDQQLLKNFYLNEGYYDVNISSSFARLIDNKYFELIFNIDAKEKIYFNNLELNLPSDFEPKNFENISELFRKLKGENYSINEIENILDEIDKITLNEEYENINAYVDDSIENNLINLKFNIDKAENLIVERINIFGNNITRENVIQNQLEVDEGEFYILKEEC